jgi:hypothetical protein
MSLRALGNLTADDGDDDFSKLERKKLVRAAELVYPISWSSKQSKKKIGTLSHTCVL